MLNIDMIEAQALDQIRQEREAKARTKIIAKLREIADAERVLQNLRNDLEAIKRDIGSEV